MSTYDQTLDVNSAVTKHVMLFYDKIQLLYSNLKTDCTIKTCLCLLLCIADHAS